MQRGLEQLWELGFETGGHPANIVGAIRFGLRLGDQRSHSRVQRAKKLVAIGGAHEGRTGGVQSELGPIIVSTARFCIGLMGAGCGLG